MATDGVDTKSKSSMEEGGMSGDETKASSQKETSEGVKLSPEFSSEFNINQPEVIEIESDNENDCQVICIEEKDTSTIEITSQTLESKTNVAAEKVESILVEEQNDSAEVRREFHVYKCDCGEHFEKSTDFAAHKRWTCKLVKKNVQCGICKSYFAHQQGLKRHMRHAHDGVFKCTKCNLRFHNLIKLSRHWMEFHYDENKVGDKLKCFLCGDDSFSSKFHLETHLLSHKYNRLQKKNIMKGGASFEGRAQETDEDIMDFLPNDGATSMNKSSESYSSQPSEVDAVDSSSRCHPANIHRKHHGHHRHHKHDHWGHHHDKRHHDHHHKHCSDSPDSHDRAGRSHHFLPPHFLGNNPMYPPPHHPHHLPPPSHHHFPYHPPPPESIPHPHPPPPPAHFSHRPAENNINVPQSSSTATSHEMPPPPHLPYGLGPHSPFMGKYNKHLNRWKWKRYFKNIMNQYLAPWSLGFVPPFVPPQADSHSQHQPLNLNINPPSEPASVETSTPTNATTTSTNATATSTNSTATSTNSTATATNSNATSTNSTPASSVIMTPAVNAKSERDQDQASFQMACTFCDEVLEKGKAIQHRLQECPVLSCAFKCNVCGRAFNKLHRLILHRKRQGHFQSSDSDLAELGVGGDPYFVSNLQEKLHSVLGFQTPSETSITSSGVSNLQEKLRSVLGFNQTLSEASVTSSGISHLPTSKTEQEISGENCAASKSAALQQPSREGVSDVTERSCNNKKDSEMLMEETVLVIDEGKEEEASKPISLQCSVCQAYFNIAAVLLVHLQAHITHVTAVQKVHEWKKKSSRYFYDRNKAEESSVPSPVSCMDSSADAISTVTDTSFQDTNSVQISTLSSTIEGASEKYVSMTESEKWMKPHCKKKRKGGCDKKLFPCEFCTETFSFKRDLLFHVKEKHGDQKKHLECPVCQRKFSWKKRGQFFERHLNSHYGVTIFKHKCDVCAKTFLEKSKLQDHMAMHTSDLLHACNICGKGYGSKSSLTRHLRHHTGDKPHQCEECSESFLEKRELLRHAAIHTGTPAFACSHCGQGFTLKTSLDTHVKRKHSSEES